MRPVNHGKQRNPGAEESATANTAWLQALLARRAYGRLQEALAQWQQAATAVDEIVLAQVLAAAVQVASNCQALQAQEKEWTQALSLVNSQQAQMHAQLARLVQAVGAVSGAVGGAAGDAPGDGIARVETVDFQAKSAETAVSPPATWWQRLHCWWQQRLAAPPAIVAEVAPPPPETAVPPPPAVIPAQPLLLVHCLGAFRLMANELAIEKWPGAKAKLLFKYLALHRAQPAHQEVLMARFWPDVDPDAARHSLYQAVYLLRQTLQAADSNFPFLVTENGSYCFHPELPVWVDRDEFVQRLAAGRRLARQERWGTAVAEFEIAETLYEGDLLVEDPYEEWLLAPREELKLAYLDLLDRLGRYYYQQQRWGRCVAYCRQILQRDACREDVQRRLMRAYVAQGQRHLAIRQYHACRRSLQEELAVAPMPETEALFAQLKTAV